MIVCTLWRPRWHGWAPYEVKRYTTSDDFTGGTLVEYLERGWVRRPRNAPFYEWCVDADDRAGSFVAVNGV